METSLLFQDNNKYSLIKNKIIKFIKNANNDNLL